MKKCLLAVAASVVLSQAALADDPAADNKTTINCPEVSVLQAQTLIEARTSSSTGPARFDGKYSPISAEYKTNSNGYSYISNTSWTLSANGIKAKDASEAAEKIKTIMSHLSAKGILKPMSNNNFVCEYTIDPADLANYTESETKPTVTASAYFYVGNYLFAK